MLCDEQVLCFPGWEQEGRDTFGDESTGGHGRTVRVFSIPNPAKRGECLKYSYCEPVGVPVFINALS